MNFDCNKMKKTFGCPSKALTESPWAKTWGILLTNGRLGSNSRAKATTILVHTNRDKEATLWMSQYLFSPSKKEHGFLRRVSRRIKLSSYQEGNKSGTRKMSPSEPNRKIPKRNMSHTWYTWRTSHGAVIMWQLLIRGGRPGDERGRFLLTK